MEVESCDIWKLRLASGQSWWCKPTGGKKVSHLARRSLALSGKKISEIALELPLEDTSCRQKFGNRAVGFSLLPALSFPRRSNLSVAAADFSKAIVSSIKEPSLAVWSNWKTQKMLSSCFSK